MRSLVSTTIITTVIYLWSCAVYTTHIAYAEHNDAQSVYKIAVVSNGNITDFGWTYMVNKGIVDTERELNVNGLKLFENYEAYDVTYKLMKSLVKDNYQLIIAATNTIENVTLNVARESLGTNTKFVIVNAATNYDNDTNISVLRWQGVAIQYVLGVYAASATKTGKVGILVPGTNADRATSANSFFLGVNDTNPNVEVYMAWTESFYNPDRATLATQALLDVGIDVISQNQDDFTVQKLLMENGILALGSSGFNLGDIFGEDIAFSIIRKWSIGLKRFVQQIIDNNWKKMVVAANFGTGMLDISNFSYLVSNTSVTTVNNTVTRLKTGYNPVPTAISSNFKTDIPDIKLLGTFKVPTTEIKMPQSKTSAMVALLAIALFLITVNLFAVIYFSFNNGGSVKFLVALPQFLIMVNVGAISVLIGLFLFANPSRVISYYKVGVSLVSLGFCILFTSLTCKTFYIWYILTKQEEWKIHTESDKTRVLDTLKLLGRLTRVLLVVNIAVNLIIVIIFDCAGGAKLLTEFGVDDIGKYDYKIRYTQNNTGTNCLIAMLVHNILTIFMGSIAAFKARQIQIMDKNSDRVMDSFNESAPVTNSCLCILGCIVVCVAVVLTVPSYDTKIFLMVLVMILPCVLSIVALFLPKYMEIKNSGPTWKDNIKTASGGTRNSTTQSAEQSQNADGWGDV